MSEKPFIPHPIVANFNEAIQRELTKQEALIQLIARNQRKGHREEPDPVEVARFHHWKETFEHFASKGAAEGWVEQIELDELAFFPPLGTWVWDESEDEYWARINPNGDSHVTFPVVSRND
jgi:hypothetical protein